ncbi:MAG: hypothetical protein R3Y11_06685 [Pseudomonadota bacterium]
MEKVMEQETYVRPTDAESLEASVDYKIDLVSQGLEVEFDPEEAELAGCFVEDALTEEEAQDARYDVEA